MNNLHRELAPISAAAWAGLEQEAQRTFKRHVAARRVVDVPQPGGPDLAAVTTGHLDAVAPPAEGVLALPCQALAQPVAADVLGHGRERYRASHPCLILGA